MSWTRSGVRVPPIPGPKELFEKLFIGEPASQLTRVKDKHALQGSILDAVHGDAKRLQQRIDKEDKEKLEEYLNSVREVEKQLQLKKQWVEVPKPKAPFEKPKNKNCGDPPSTTGGVICPTAGSSILLAVQVVH